jgi:N-sulfoglucosamine sulfohydrolase
MNRRRFLAAAGLGLCAAPGFRPATGKSAAPRGARMLPSILVCVADDWGWPHAGIYGDKVVKTPGFDRVAEEGALFRRAYCAAPSCTPSRAAILTGQVPHRLDEGADLWSFLPNRFPVYPDLLEAAGYVVGMKGKGWGPGNYEAGGWKRNPAGPAEADFAAFLKKMPADRPFCFWFGSNDPHRDYELGSGARSGMKLADVHVPPYLPDDADVRSDILDYYFEVQRFDRDVEQCLNALAKAGRLDETIVVVTSDNGWPFPRSKANLYDYGTHMPLAIRWPERIRGRTRVDEFVSLTDLAPTFLEAARLTVPSEMTGRSLWNLLSGETDAGRDQVFTERERHANVRRGDLGYPSRAVQTAGYLYIRNFRPDRWPAGDPEPWKAVGPFGDIDNGPTKAAIVDNSDDPVIARLFELACAKRPSEELYDLRNDPYQLINVAERREFRATRENMRNRLENWMRRTRDPRALIDDDRFDRYPYFGSTIR